MIAEFEKWWENYIEESNWESIMYSGVTEEIKEMAEAAWKASKQDTVNHIMDKIGGESII